MARPPKSELNGVSAVYALRLASERPSLPNDDAFRERFPSLFSYLTTVEIGPGLFMEPLRLSIQNASGDWAIGLSAPALGGYTSVLAPTVDAGLAALNEGLATGTLRWKFDQRKSPKIRKRTQQPKSS